MPNVQNKNGVQMINPTMWEQIASMLPGIMQAVVTIKKRGEERKQKAKDHEDAQTDLRLKLHKLESEDPVAYNASINDPAIAHFLSPESVQEILHRGEGPFTGMGTRRQAKKDAESKETRMGPVTTGPTAVGEDPNAVTPKLAASLPKAPSLSGLTPASEDSITAAGLERKAKIAGYKASISSSEVMGAVNDYRKGLLAGDDLASKLEGIYGAVPTGTDMAVKGGFVTAAGAAEQIPGTLPWKQTQARMMAKEISATSADAGDPVNQGRIQQYSEWLLGLRPDKPANLPPSMAQAQLEMERKAQTLRDNMYNFDRDRYIAERRKMTFDTAGVLRRMGVDPQISIDVAEQYLNTGKLPEGLVLAPDKQEAAEIELAGLKVQLAQKELEKAQADDPEIAHLIQVLQQYPTAKTNADPHAKYDTPEFRRLMNLMAAKHGWKPEAAPPPSWWDNVLGSLGRMGGGGTGSAPVQTPASGAAPATATTTRAAAPATATTTTAAAPAAAAGTWTPQVQEVFNQTAQKSIAAANVMPMGYRTRLAALQEEMKAAGIAKDATKMIDVSNRVEALLTEFQNEGR